MRASKAAGPTRTQRASLASVVALGLLAAAGNCMGQINYPETHRVDQVDDYHGVKVADPYRWLEDANSPDTAAWVAAQNRVTRAYLDRLPQRSSIKARITELFNYPRFHPPFHPRGGSSGPWFHFKNDGLQNQAALYVQPRLDAEPLILLDPNSLSKDGTIALSAPAPSRDGKLLAYGLQSGGSDWQQFHIRSIATGEDLPDLLRWIKNSGVAWTHDNKGFFYTRYPAPRKDEELRAVNHDARLYYHAAGTPQAEDPLIYALPEHPDWSVHATLTDDGRYALLYVHEGTDPRDRIYYMDLGSARSPNLKAAVVKLLDEFDAAYSVIGNDGPVFYLWTDQNAPRGRVVAIDIRRPECANWKEALPESEDTLQSARLVGNRLVALYLRDAHSRLVIRPLTGGADHEVTLPGPGTVSELTGHRQDAELFFSFTSPLHPPSIYRYHVEKERLALYRAPELTVDASPFETRQVFYRSKDGARIPMMLTYRKGLERNGASPVYLYGYGGFNVSLTPGFSASALTWVEHGGIYAVPNLRGGGEYGQEWHKAGTLERKQNVFDDFIAAAEYLIHEKYTSPGRIAIAGGSNGGLLVGAVMTQRPDLWGAALPAVGVLDMLRYHLFTIGWMWKSDYGCSEDPQQFKYLYAYSPLHNLKPGAAYPPTLITTGDHDDRVVPAHSFKFAAALQAVKQTSAAGGDSPALIRIETRAGHGAGKPTAKLIDEAADVLAFAMQSLGMKPAGSAPR